MDLSLQDRVIAITGGSEGIGAAIAEHAAQCGGKVAILSRDEQDMQQEVDKITASGGRAMWVATDVTQSDQVAHAVQQICQKWGRIDGLVANAGTNGTWAPVDELTPEQWRQTIDINLTGTYLAIHHAIPRMKPHGGSIVIVSSINGTRTFSNEGASAYATSKAGQYALAKMLALELAPSRIRVNVICPGAIETNIHEKTEREHLERIETPVEFPEGNIPLTGGRMGSPQQVAHVATFLLSDYSSHVTGTPIWVDGGQSLLQ